VSTDERVDTAMPKSEPAPTDAVVANALELKPALASIKSACEYLGGISRSKFYSDVLPLLETIKFGARNLVIVASMDRLIASRSKSSLENPPQTAGLPEALARPR
jgi:hypothetical protein